MWWLRDPDSFHCVVLQCPGNLDSFTSSFWAEKEREWRVTLECSWARSIGCQKLDTRLPRYEEGEIEFLAGQLIPRIKLIQRMWCTNPWWTIGLCYRDEGKADSTAPCFKPFNSHHHAYKIMRQFPSMNVLGRGNREHKSQGGALQDVPPPLFTHPLLPAIPSLCLYAIIFEVLWVYYAKFNLF